MALTDRSVKAAKPGRHSDGGNLSLLVQRTGSRSWVLRVQRNGQRRDVGLGPYPAVSLAAAREKARELRGSIKSGEDREAPTPEVLTFQAAAEALIASKRIEWRNAKHSAQWPSTLAMYAYPILGDRDVASITTEDVLKVLKPIWTTKTETAMRVRQRIETVLSYAMTLQGRYVLNPAAWKGHLANLLPKPSKVRKAKHFAALPWDETPAFFAELMERPGISPLALAFTILTASRSGEVRGMTWGEVDLAKALWLVPGNRMKAGRDHRVPLVPAALSLLGEPGRPDALVFPSPTRARAGVPLSDMTLSAVIKRMHKREIAEGRAGYLDPTQRRIATPHGFRSTFRDWAGEATAHPREVIEMALAHGIKDKAEAAYARGDLLEKRRRLMEDWAAFLAGSLVPDT